MPLSHNLHVRHITAVLQETLSFGGGADSSGSFPSAAPSAADIGGATPGFFFFAAPRPQDLEFAPAGIGVEVAVAIVIAAVVAVVVS